jgi:hypothetical protein
MEADAARAFARYRDYLAAEAHRFPPHALALATADWYFLSDDHRCPHDAWLQHVRLTEVGRGKGQQRRRDRLRIQLLGAYHDMILTFTYKAVIRYVLRGDDLRSSLGHADWRYDEFRVNNEGHLVHEIEWWQAWETGRWLIEAEDVEFQWRPRDGGT